MLRNTVKKMCLWKEKGSFSSVWGKKKSSGRCISFGKSRRVISHKFIRIVKSLLRWSAFTLKGPTGLLFSSNNDFYQKKKKFWLYKYIHFNLQKTASRIIHTCIIHIKEQKLKSSDINKKQKLWTVKKNSSGIRLERLRGFMFLLREVMPSSHKYRS